MGNENAISDGVSRFRTSSRVTRIQRYSTGRRLRFAAIGAIVSACPASMLIGSRAGPGEVGNLLALALGASPAVLFLASLMIGQVESIRAGEVAVTASTLRIDRGTAGVFEAPLSAVESAFLRDFRDGAEVYFLLRNRDVVCVEVRTAAEGQALVAAAGQEPSRRRASVTLSHAWLSALYWLVGAPTLVVGSIFAAVTARREFGGSGSFDRAIAAGFLFGLVVAVLGGLVLGVEVSVGTDGVTLRRAIRRHFIPFDDLDRVEYAGDMLVFVTRHGKRYRYFVKADHVLSPGALVERIQQAWRCARNGLRGEGSLGLAREGRDVGSWKKAIAEGVAGKDGYRASALSLDDLRRVLVDASAPAEHRIAAALALSESNDAADRERVRVAVDATASPRVRVAIDHAAKGQLAEEELDAALEESRGAEDAPG
jgi:hypothetical protein